MDMDITPIKVTADMTPAVQTVSDIVMDQHKGIRCVVKALLSSLLARMNRGGILQEAQNEADAKAIMEGRKRYEDGMLMDVIPYPNKEDMLNYIAVGSQIEEAKCLLLAVKEAAKRIKEIPEKCIPNEAPTQTFFNRWRKEVEVVDDEQLRQLWVDILTAEVAKPGAIGFRTMDVVRNLSHADAQIFQEMVQGKIDNVLPITENGHPQFGNYSNALQMQEAGLLSAQVSQRHWQNVFDDDGRKRVVSEVEGSDLVVCADGEDVSISSFIMTEAGIQLSRLILGRRDLESVIGVIAFIQERHKDKVFSIHQRIYDSVPDQLRWARIPLWTSKKEEKSAAGK